MPAAREPPQRKSVPQVPTSLLRAPDVDGEVPPAPVTAGPFPGAWRRTTWRSPRTTSQHEATACLLQGPRSVCHSSTMESDVTGGGSPSALPPCAAEEQASGGRSHTQQRTSHQSAGTAVTTTPLSPSQVSQAPRWPRAPVLVRECCGVQAPRGHAMRALTLGVRGPLPAPPI